MASFMGGLIQLAVSSIVLSSVFIVTIKGTNTDTWSTGEVALWGAITLVAIAGFINGVVVVFGLG